jgi:outer membrane autotransporter protein
LPRSTHKIPCPVRRRLTLSATSSLTLISIAGLVGIVGWSPSALADCPNPAAAGQTIICTGMDTDGLTSTYDNTTVNVVAGANVTNNTRAIYLSGSDNSTVTISGDAVVFGDDDVIVLNGDDGLIELTDQARIVAGTNDHGLDVIGDGNTILMRGASSVTLASTGGTGININSDEGFVELKDNALIESNSATSFGISLSGEDAEIFLHGDARVDLAGAGSTGIQLLGEDADLFLNDNAQINVSGANGIGIEAADDNAFIYIEDHASISATGTNSDAVLLSGDDNHLIIGYDAIVRAAGANSHAIHFSGTNNDAFNQGTIEAEDVAVLGGANRDKFANAGTIRSDGALAIDLAGGDDDLSLGPGSDIIGNVDGGAGDDYLTLIGLGQEDSNFLNFELLRVVSGPPFSTHFSLSGTSTFSTGVTVFSGRLLVDGTITSPDTEVQIDGSLGGNGRLISDVASAGVIAPGSSIGTLTIQGDLLQTGGSTLEVEYGDDGLDRLDVTGTVTLMNSPKLRLESLGGTAGINGIVLHSDTAITGSFAAPEYNGNGAATLVQSANDIRLLGLDGTQLVASNDAALQAGIEFMNVVSAQQIDRRSTCLNDTCAVEGGRRLWAQGFARFDHEEAGDGNMAYHDRIAGSALGGDIAIAGGWSLGGSLGYANTLAKLSDGGAKADIDGAFAALYATYEYESFFITGMANGGLQQFDLTRDVSTNDGADTARADTDGWVAGGGIRAGMKLDFPGGWRLTPNIGALYQHQSVDGYDEKGAGDGNISIGRQTSDALRLQAGLDVARTLPFEDFALIPYLQLGAMGQINFGDDVPGSFSNGSDFTIALRDGVDGAALVGAGMDIEFMNGVTANIGYLAEHAEDTDHMLRAGVSVKW